MRLGNACGGEVLGILKESLKEGRKLGTFAPSSPESALAEVIVEVVVLIGLGVQEGLNLLLLGQCDLIGALIILVIAGVRIAGPDLLLNAGQNGRIHVILGHRIARLNRNRCIHRNVRLLLSQDGLLGLQSRELLHQQGLLLLERGGGHRNGRSALDGSLGCVLALADVIRRVRVEVIRVSLDHLLRPVCESDHEGVLTDEGSVNSRQGAGGVPLLDLVLLAEVDGRVLRSDLTLGGLVLADGQPVTAVAEEATGCEGVIGLSDGEVGSHGVVSLLSFQPKLGLKGSFLPQLR